MGIAAPKSILILKPSSFGDVIHTLPAVARIRDVWPKCHVSWLVNTEWAPLLKDNPDIDEVIPFPRRNFRGFLGVGAFLRWCREKIMGRRPDLALDFQGLLRSAIIGRASQPTRFYGMEDAREGARWFYDDAAPMPTGVPHSVHRYRMLADFAFKAMGVRAPDVPMAELKFPLPPGDPSAKTGVQMPEGFVALHPFARGAGKSLTASQIRAFCERLGFQRVVLIGKRGTMDYGILPVAVNLVDQTSLAELIWVIRRASCVISVDSGPSHVAAALNTPLIAIHTWSDPRKVGPPRGNAWVWKNGRLQTMEQIARQDEAFFRQPPKPLSAADIDAICDRAISLSRFYA